ncbi:MAG TPA: class I SAM-dependent methyltransferase [Gemmatimonadota bacterium]|nr:class I SAM-dependent methyltransferase [Gemmatimonadota bacterium]
MDPSYAAAYRELYERHWWWRAREAFLLERLRAASGGGVGRRILDVGCGDALFFDELAAFGTVRGVEPDADVLSEGPWRHAIHAGTLETFSPEGPFDWILMLDVLEHIETPGATLARAREFAADGASLFLTVPAFESLWTRHDDLNYHFRRYNRSAFLQVLSGTGWELAESEYFFHWLAPLKLLVKLKERLVKGDLEVESVPSRPLNAVALAVSTVERRVFSRLQLPFGTSLYARCVASSGLGGSIEE